MPLLGWGSELDREREKPIIPPALAGCQGNGRTSRKGRSGPALGELALQGEPRRVQGEAGAPHQSAGGEGREQEVLRRDRNEERDHLLRHDGELLERAE